MKSTPLLVLLLVGLVGAGSACSIHSFQAALAANPYMAQASNAYNVKEVVEALEGLGSATDAFVFPQKTTFACVDARGQGIVGGLHAVPTLETPGGDFAELAALIIVYHRMKNTTATESSVSKIFNHFMKKVATAKRPFYMHSADDKLQHSLEEYHNLTGEEVVVVPSMEPKDKESRDAWYESLLIPMGQGCGHIRYMMLSPSAYDLNTPAEVALPANLIKAFFKYWWPTKEGSAQRAKIAYPILQGALGGGALAIVNSVGPGCEGEEPDLAPFHDGASMYLYQANAVATMRSAVLIPFIKSYDRKIDAAAGASLLDALNALQAKQLQATLQLLSPLNKLPIYTVNVTVNPV